MAKENDIKLLLINRNDDDLLEVEGIDLKSIKRGFNPSGRPIVTGVYVHQPIRNEALMEGLGDGIRPTYTALCLDNVLVDWLDHWDNFKSYPLDIPSQKFTDFLHVKIYMVLCSIGDPEATISIRSVRQSSAATPQPAINEPAPVNPAPSAGLVEPKI